MSNSIFLLAPLLMNPQSQVIELSIFTATQQGEGLLEDGVRHCTCTPGTGCPSQEGHSLRLPSDFAGDVVWGSCMMQGDIGP